MFRKVCSSNRADFFFLYIYQQNYAIIDMVI